MVDKTSEELAAEERQMQIDRGDFIDDDPDHPANTATGSDDDDDAPAKPAKTADPDAEPEDDPKKEPPGVPYARFNQVHAEMETARERALRLEGENKVLREQAGRASDDSAKVDEPKAVVVDVDTLREQAAEAIMQGDVATYTKLNKEADAELSRQADARAEARLAKWEVDQEAKRADAAAKETGTAMQAAAAAIFKEFPFLDENHKDVNEDAVAMVVALRDKMIVKGENPVDAMKAAAEVVGNLYKAPGNGGTNGKDPNALRTAAALARNADAANRQPASPIGGRGERGRTHPVQDVAKMSDEEFRAMPERDKAIARGDIVE